MKIEIGKNIKALRQEKQITQEQLADALGMTPQAISLWENGKGYPDIETIPALAAFFSVSSDELLGINNSLRQQRLMELTAEMERLADRACDREDNLKEVDFARLAVAEFPSEKILQLRLADCICRAYMWEENPDSVKLNEAERIYNGTAADAYRAMATYQLAQEKYEAALDSLEKSCDYSIAFDRSKAGEHYQSAMVSRLLSETKEEQEHNLSWIVLHGKFSQKRYDVIRREPRFIKITERLKETAQ